jgi:hypothetical protein
MNTQAQAQAQDQKKQLAKQLAQAKYFMSPMANKMSEQTRQDNDEEFQRRYRLFSATLRSLYENSVTEEDAFKEIVEFMAYCNKKLYACMIETISGKLKSAEFFPRMSVKFV